MAPAILIRHWLAQLRRRASRVNVSVRARLTVLALVLVVVLHRFRRRLVSRITDLKARGAADCSLGEVAPALPPIAYDSAPRFRQPQNGNALGLSNAYKTGWSKAQKRQCTYFAAGCCTYGDDCFLSHDVDAAEKARAISRLRWKKDICSFFVMGLDCGKPSKYCQYAHGAEELTSWSPKPPAFFPSSGLPYSDSHCHLDGILFVRRFGYHWPYKTKLCVDYVTEGRRCTWDSNCHYAHGEHELRERPSLEPAHLVELADVFPAGFDGLVHNCCDGETIETTVKLVEWGREVLDGKIYATFGVHPTDFMTYTDKLETSLLDAFARCGDRAVAWGECGLDYYRNPSPEDRLEMRQVFIRQIRVAVERGLPIVIHSRNAEADTLEVLREHLPHDTRMHLHSFEGSVDLLARFLEEWPMCYLGVNGVVTYPTGGYLAELVRYAPLERILLETDGPFMMPEPYRYGGLGSHAGHIPWIAARVAAIKDLPPEVVLARTHVNMRVMYGIGGNGS